MEELFRHGTWLLLDHQPFPDPTNLLVNKLFIITCQAGVTSGLGNAGIKEERIWSG